MDHPSLSPEPSVQILTPARSPPHNDHFTTSTGRPQLNPQIWASPAFLKRSHFLPTNFDPFAEEEFPDNERRKRTKFGRGSGEWRFAERTPSPEKEAETSPLEIASVSRLPAQDRNRGEQVQSLIQPSVATNALTDRSGLEVQSEDEAIAKDTSVEEEEKTSTSIVQLNGDGHTIREITNDGETKNIAIAIPRDQPWKTNINAFETPNEREEVDSSIARSPSPTSKADYVDDEVPQEPAQIAQTLPSALIEILSSAPSSSAPQSDQESDETSDQESDDASHQESDSLFGEQSESGQSNAAMHSGPTPDFGLDGSISSRLSLTAEFTPPPSVVNRLEGLEVDDLKTGDAQDISSTFQGNVEQLRWEAEEPLTSRNLAAEPLLSDNAGSGRDFLMLHAVQQRSSVQSPSSDRLGGPEAGELGDEAMQDPAAAHLLADDRGPSKDIDDLQDENAVQRFSSNPLLASNEFESRVAQEELELRSHDISDNEAALDLVPEKSPLELPKEQSPSSNRGKEGSSETSNEEDTLGMSPEKGLADPALRQESPNIRQQDMALDAKLFREDSKILYTHGQEIRNHAEGVSMLTPKIQRTVVEIIDLESDDEDAINSQSVGQKGSQAFVGEDGSGPAPTNKVSAYDKPLPLVSDARTALQTSMNEADRLPTLPNSMGLVLKPVAAVEEYSSIDVHTEPEAREEVFEPEKGSRKQSPVAKTKGHQEELPLIDEATLQRSQDARLISQERELPSEEESRLKQPAVAETELNPILIAELPSTVPDSFEDIMSKSHLLTPSSSQRTNFMSQPSSVSLHSAPEDDTLPTPQLTQATSAGIRPTHPLAPPEESILLETPAPPKKTSALIEKLREMRRLSNQNPKTRSSDASILDPWFAPKRLSQVVPDSEDESEAESSSERKQQIEDSKIIGRQLPKTPEKPLAKLFIRSPAQPEGISSIQSSPQYHPPSQPPPPGFRTNLSYFVPLATLPSHFATTVDILAITLSSTPVTRATSGPRDYNQTIYISDPSSSALQHSITTSITTAQVFRPNNRCFPLVEKGDALLLRDFRVQSFQTRPSLLSTESSAWAVFRKGADVQVRGPPVEFGAEERGFARGLWDWWASLDDDARMRFENAVPEYKKPTGTSKTTKSKTGGDRRDAPIKDEQIEGLGIDLPGSQTKRRESMKERSLGLNGVEEKDMVHESIEAPKRVLRARGAKGANGRSESARESRFGTVFTGGLGEPDQTQGSTHELRDGKAYRDKRK